MEWAGTPLVGVCGSAGAFGVFQGDPGIAQCRRRCPFGLAGREAALFFQKHLGLQNAPAFSLRARYARHLLPLGFGSRSGYFKVIRDRYARHPGVLNHLGYFRPFGIESVRDVDGVWASWARGICRTPPRSAYGRAARGYLGPLGSLRSVR